MAITKEFREFFLRHVQVTTGNKADQEVNFPINYYIGSTQVFNRFLKNDYPTKQVFEKLFESLTFKLNKEDRATLTEQGLAIIASDLKAKNGTDASTGEFTEFIVAHQLPGVIVEGQFGSFAADGSEIINKGISVQPYLQTISLGVTRRVYMVRVKADANGSITANGQVALVNDQATPGNNKVYATNNAGTKGWVSLLPIGTIILMNGNSVPAGGQWNICDGSNGTPNIPPIVPNTIYMMKT